jgi:hypothetical protein
MVEFVHFSFANNHKNGIWKNEVLSNLS